MLKLGDTFQETFQLIDEVYQGFIHTFKDYNPLHTQVDFAQNKGFKDKVMHGNILNGFLSYFIGECLSTKDVMIISQTINYHAPVYLDNQVDFEAKISEVSEAVSLYAFKYVFKVSGKKVAKGKIQIKLI